MIRIATLLLICLYSATVAEQSIFDECKGSHCDDTKNAPGNTTCLPDDDGNVGNTSGKSYVVLYAFGMETKKKAEIVDILKKVKESIETFLIGKYLSKTCTSRHLQNETVTGFRFGAVQRSGELHSLKESFQYRSWNLHLIF